MTYHQIQQIEQAPAAGSEPDDQRVTISATWEASRILDEVRVALSRDPAAARASVERLALLLRTAAESGECSPARGGLAPWQKRKIEAHIEDQLSARIPITTLADLASLSAGHFSRAFKETFGASPHAYIIRRRIARAQELMLTSREPLGQIALICGFADQAHFCTLFRRFIGETPNAWRRTDGAFG